MNIYELEPLYYDLCKRLTQLEEGYKRLEKVLQNIPVGVIVLSKQGWMTYVNRCACQILELEKISLCLYWDVFTDDYLGCSMRALLDGSACEHRVLLTIGQQREVEVIATASEEGVTLLLQDRTHSLKLERTLQHNQQLQALGEMAACLAHEIRNPLGGIEGFASLLKQELVNDEHRQMARAIIDGSRTLNALVTSVLDYSKPLELHFQMENMVEIVKESCQLSGGQAVFKALCKSSPILADKERLKLAFLNLIRNGWEAADHKPVEVYVDQHQITFKDYGKGIASQHLPHIFTPFFTTKVQGTGLGLSEAHKVIRAHGGKLELTQTSESGTIFTVSWNHDSKHSDR
ncbi:MAG: PAS domain-containing protein [Verrucomicrobia bacterium]|nr:PAS domain-containing protein [Verrucomicrobiota bacterium]MBS0646176.1 PAS domain-containing protein [Verrucomicrobiota bacterium]